MAWMNSSEGRLGGQSGEIFSAADKLVRREEPLHEDKMAKLEGKRVTVVS